MDTILPPGQFSHTIIEAMGGQLKIVAHFPDGDVVINQFQEI